MARASGDRDGLHRAGQSVGEFVQRVVRSRLRDELLNCEIFTTLLEAQVLIEDHRRLYNDQRIHGSLGYFTPTEFTASLHQEEEPKASAKEEAKAAAGKAA